MTGFSSIRSLCIAGMLFLSSMAWAEKPAGNEEPIECLARGRTGPMSLTMDDAEIRYALPRGVTAFIIHLEARGQRRCFTLVNESPAAAGKLSIATANQRLAANDPKWRAVDGAVHFRQKKLFALSLIGVDAKFVKLTFQVDRLEKSTRHAEQEQMAANRFTAQP